MPRLFVATDLPAALRSRLFDLARGAPGARPVAVEQIHLTLRFAGELDEVAGSGLREALARVDEPRFAIRLRELGLFPQHGRPRGVWLAVEPSEPLARLRRAVEAAAVEAGLEPESRPFRPHLTLARVREADRRALRAWLDDRRGLEWPETELRELRLYSSELRPAGAVHRLEWSAPLR